MFGIGRNKPAILFTPQERNNKDNRNCYHRRKPIWLMNTKKGALSLCQQQKSAE